LPLSARKVASEVELYNNKIGKGEGFMIRDLEGKLGVRLNEMNSKKLVN